MWKHLDWRTDSALSRRGRKLVIMFLCTIANYTYGFSFKLSLDPSIELEATLTGILSMGALSATESRAGRPWGQTLTPHGLYGPDHQHFFVARLDLAVDGTTNRVLEIETEPAGRVGDEADAYVAEHGRANAFRRRSTCLESELRAARRHVHE